MAGGRMLTGFKEKYNDAKYFARNMSKSAAQRTFASNYARGGISNIMFEEKASDVFWKSLKGGVRANSPEHIKNLEAMSQKSRKGIKGWGSAKRTTKALSAARKANAAGKIGPGVIGRTFGGVLGVGLIVGGGALAEGPIQEKARGAATGLGAAVGWQAGGTVGAATGAAIGSVLGPLGVAAGYAVGYIAGGFIGSEAGMSAADAATRVPDRLVEKERAKRQFTWANDNSAFMTKSAHTMRQQSLQAMNSGMMSARSMLGREGVMLHQ